MCVNIILYTQSCAEVLFLSIDRCVLLREHAREAGCQDDGFMDGLVCTNRCEYRATCTIKKAKLLFSAEISDVILKNEDETICGLICSTDILTGFKDDEYIIGGQERKI